MVRLPVYTSLTVDSVGLGTLPDFHLFYLVTMLTHAHNWGGGVVRASFHPMLSIKPVVRAWNQVLPRIKDSFGCSTPHILLWVIRNLFQSIPYPSLWASRGVKYLTHICEDGSLKTFDTLKSQLNHLNTRHFPSFLPKLIFSACGHATLYSN